MKQASIQTVYMEYSYDELPESYRILVDNAKEATSTAYAPYSNFHVGAALLLENGEIIRANNQENSAYPSGLCAERVTMFYANAQYPNVAPTAMAIAAHTKGNFVGEPISPCGSCRQVLLESEERYGRPIEIILYGTNSVYKINSVRSLLPFAFGKDSL